MKLIRAEITGFGHYRQQTFDFEAGNQLIFGENEAGKSTLYQFVQAILFGFPAKRNRRKDYTPQDGASYGGKLVLLLPPYGEVTIERYKQLDRGRAKVFFQGRQGDEKTLQKLLAPLNLQAFQQIYTFQQEQLSQLEQLREKELHDALVSLGISGSRQLLAQRQEYLQQSQKLFKPRGQKLPLNQRLKAWQQLQEQIAAKEQEESQFHDILQQQALVEQRLTKLQNQLQELENKLLTLKEQRNYWPQYEEWQQLQGQQRRASAADPQRLAAFYQRYTQLHQQLLEQQETLQKLEAKQDLSEKYRFYLAHENELKNLLQQQVAAVRVTDDFQRALQDQKELIQQLEELEARYGWAPENPPAPEAGELYQYMTEQQRLTAVIAEKGKQGEWLAERLQREQPTSQETAQTGKALWLLAAGLIVAGGVTVSTLGRFGWLLVIAGLLVGAGQLLRSRRQLQVVPQTLLADTELQQQLQENHQSLQREQAALKQLQGKLHRLVPSIAPEELTAAKVQDYQAAVQVYYEANEELQQVDAKLTGLDREYGRFDRAFEFLAPWLPLPQKDLVGKMALLRQFADEMEQVRLQEKLPAASVLREQIKEKQQQLATLLQDDEGLLQAAGINQPSEIPIWLDKLQKLAQEQRREQELAQILQDIFPEPVTLAELQKELATTEQTIRRLQGEGQQLTKQQQRQLLQIQQLQADGTLDELYQRRSDLESQIRELTVTWSSQQVSGAVLNDLATELSAQQLPQLLQTAGHYFRILTEEAYQSVDFVDGELVAVTRQQSWPIYDLSTGTRDQLVMAIRFGYLALQKSRPLCPVIIDDGWLHYDSHRKAQLAQLLAEFGENYQVICLSSDQEMVSYYQKRQQPVRSIG